MACYAARTFRGSRVADETSPSFWNALRQRKLVQWALAYLAAAWVLLQVLDMTGARFGWPDGLLRGCFIAAGVGLFVTLLLAWYHGERGAQKVSGTELLLLALLLLIGGGLLWGFARAPQARGPDAAQRFSTAQLVNPGTVNPDYAAGAASSGLRASSTQTVPIPAKSIAVLPFVNMSGDSKNDYFSDGITEEILDALAKAPDLKVAARTSAFAFKGKAQDLRKVGEALGVATVLEGSVQTEGDAVRITAQLIDARSGFHLWSDHYDRKLTDVFAVEDEISRAIADKLQAQLDGTTSTAKTGTTNPHAHELYLRGLTLLAARSLRDAADTFRQAVTADPNYAQAWAALAQAQVLVHNWHLDSDGSAMPAAEDAVQRALELDPNIATAYVALGILHAERWRWADAERELRRAVQLAPGDAEALDQYAQFLHDTGNFEQALPLIERANALDPYSGVIGGVYAQELKILRGCAAAKAQLDRTLAAAPDSRFARGVALIRALECKEYVEAEAQALAYAPLAGRDPASYVALVRGVADPAHRAEALRVLANLGDKGMETARFRILLGDRQGALTELENLSGQGHGIAQQIWSPIFDPLRSDPRFKAVMARIGIPYRPQLSPP